MYLNKIIKLSPIILFVIISLFLIPVNAFLKITDDYEDKLCKEKLASFDPEMKEYKMADIISEVGRSFLGTEYVAGTLDNNINPENLVICFSGLDCVTFVENTLAISRIIQKGSVDYESFKKELQLVRYRDGDINGYSSRLHYFSDWIYNNEEKNIVKNITKEIGGLPYSKKINFMTTHIDSYKQLLADDGETVSLIKRIEGDINDRNLFYIPKEDVDSYYDYFQTGDIIATTTGITGLDVSHTGFIYKDKGKTYFLHASSVAKEVIISKEELKQYLKMDKKKTGIMIARPQETK
jgi:hypothetical protein